MPYQKLKIEIEEVDCWDVSVNGQHFRRCEDYNDLARTIGKLVRSAFRPVDYE